MTDNTQKLNEILNQAVNDTHDKSLNINLSATASHNIRASIVDKAKQAILDWHNKQEATLLDALYWMYSQYCSGGHDFMGAGEDASELLENAGYITTDGAGRIVKDNGDSTEQRNKLKEVK